MIELRRAGQRFHTSQPGIETWHSFSAGAHYDPDNVAFGPLVGVDVERGGVARERLGQHEFPRHVTFVSDLPKTPAGKVNRKILRDREAAEAIRVSTSEENTNAVAR